jgi:hypothetical protein
MRYAPKLLQRRSPVNNAPNDKRRASYSWNAVTKFQKEKLVVDPLNDGKSHPFLNN